MMPPRVPARLLGLLAMTLIPGGAGSHGENGARPAASENVKSVVPPEPIVWRVGGDEEAEPKLVNGMWRFGSMRIEAPLPEGYPAPTPPAAIDIKRYPSVRRAEISSGEGSPDLTIGAAFWPLFRHIEARGIAMTSPVEMDYDEWSGEAAERPARWTMSFLYRTSDLGPLGEDGRVRVVDTEPLFVLSIGIRGPYGLDSVAKGLDELEAWLDSQMAWVADGDPRALNYNGPSVPGRERWSEVQIPIRASRPEDFSGRSSMGIAVREAGPHAAERPGQSEFAAGPPV